MSRVCELTGKRAMRGHNVSHSQRKTNREFRPNLQKIELKSVALNESLKFRVCTNAIRTIDKYGGLDNYLMKAKISPLLEKAKKLQNKIKKKVALKEKTTDGEANSTNN